MTCGSETITLRDQDIGLYTIDTQNHREFKYIIPVGESNGLVEWDLTLINYEFGYYPFWKINSPNGPQCGLERYTIFDIQNNNARIVGNTMLELDTGSPSFSSFYLEASSVGGVVSEKVSVKVGVCDT